MQNRAAGSDPSLSLLLLAIFQDNFFPFRDQTGTPMAMLFDTPGVAVTMKGLKPLLGAGLYELYGKQASSGTFDTVLNTIEGFVLRPGVPERHAWLRTGRTPDGHIGLDLGWPSGECVVIYPGGWEQALGCGVMWRRITSVEPLPSPVRGGDIGEALELVNLPDSDHRALWLAARLHQLMPEHTKPVEIFTGMAGSAKTGSTRLTVGMLGGLMANIPKDPRDWAALASNTHCIGHDNVSSISAERSDLLCKAASGESWIARKLYKDVELIQVQFQPLSVIINTIEAGTYRGDLVRRGVIYRLGKPARILFESEISQRWERAWPQALGWLLDALSWIMTWIDQIVVPEGETMPDFAKMVIAVDRWLGTNGWRAWKLGQALEYGSSVYGDVVSWAIAERITAPWEGLPKDLLFMLSLPEEPRQGPWTPERLSNRLDRATPALESQGWVIQRPIDRHKNSRRILLIPPRASS
jgi:hypothetical protein